MLFLFLSFSWEFSSFPLLSWGEAKVDEGFSANYPSLRGQGTAPFPAVLTCPSMSHSVSSTGNFLLAPCTWLCSPTRMKASTVLLGMLYTTTCQKDSVRPQGILCSCQCLPASDDFSRAGAGEEVGQEEGPWTPAACSSSSLYPSRACVGISAKSIFLSK